MAGTSKIVHFVSLTVPNITENTTFLGVFRTMSGLEVSFDVLEYADPNAPYGVRGVGEPPAISSGKAT